MLDRIWKIFSSVKLAVVLFLLISMSSIIGTVIDQSGDPDKNILFFKNIFGEKLALKAFKIAYALDFTNMYHSWWFLLFLCLFSANLIICSIDRLERIFKTATAPISPLSPDSFGKHGIKKEINLKGNFDNIKYQVRDVVKKMGFKVEELSADYGVQLFSQAGGYSRFGVYVTHLSVIVILIGSLAGLFFGFDGFLNLTEGEASDVAYSRDDMNEHSLGFSIRCDDFSVKFYGTSDTPKEYMSWLAVIKDGKEVVRRTIEVNSPLRYEGYTFYQSSYGPVTDKEGILIFSITPKGGKSENVALHVGETFKIPGTELVGKVVNYSPALSFDKEGRPMTYTEMMNNPAVYIDFFENGEEKYSGWVAKRYEQTWALPDGHIIELVDNWGTQYTGLQVRKDPGVWIVYLGCLLITIGLYTAFFMSHKKIWVLLKKEDGKVNIKISATSNKNRVAFENRIDRAIEKIKSA